MTKEQLIGLGQVWEKGSMKSVNINDISEETTYAWRCPRCNELNESSEDQVNDSEYICDNCCGMFERKGEDNV